RGLDLDVDEVAVGAPVEEVADGSGGVGLDLPHEALIAVDLDDGEGDGEAEEADAEERIDPAAGDGAVGRLLPVVVGEHAAAVGPRPEHADALDGEGVEEAVGDVAGDEGGVEVGEGSAPEPEEGEAEDGHGRLGGIAVGDGAVAPPALDAAGGGGEHA